MQRPAISFAEFCTDPNLLGDWFGDDSWATWRVIDKALFGEPLDDAEMAIFTELTGRTEAPTEQVTEFWAVIGRRGGKDNKATAIAAYLATIGAEAFGFLKRLKRGERGVVQLLAVDRDQAKVAMGYLGAYFEKPMLQKLVKKVTTDSIELRNGISIEVTTNDQRRVRGRTVICTIFDEVAHWLGEDSKNPDEAIYRAVKPSMATMMPGAMLIGISSPHMKSGLLYRKYQEHYGKPGNVLVVKAPTWVMNPKVGRDSDVIRDAYLSDPEWAEAEYGAEFRTDLAPFLTREAIEACIEAGVYERPPQRQFTYFGFTDPSGGSNDSFTLAIAHAEGKHVVLDCIREVPPPFMPDAVVVEFVNVLRSYGLSYVTGDRYGAAWVQDAFRKAGCFYVPVGTLHGPVEYGQARPPSSKSDLYLDVLPIINSRAVALLDHPKMVSQLAALERRAVRGARDTVDHPRGGHDDVANAVAGAVSLAARQTKAVYRHVSEEQEKLPPGCFGYVRDFFPVAGSRRWSDRIKL
jgi:hypothetical protein